MQLISKKSAFLYLSDILILYIDTSSTVLASVDVVSGSTGQPGYPSGILGFGSVGAGPEGPTNPNFPFNGNIAICHM